MDLWGQTTRNSFIIRKCQLKASPSQVKTGRVNQ